MPAPSTPTEVDGITLTTPQHGWLAQIISVIFAPDPTRTGASILKQSLRAFRKAHKIVRGKWIRRSVIQLGNSEASAVIALPPEEESTEV